MSQQQATPESSGMPVLGLGTWQNDDHDQCARSVETALEHGYRHIDTAQAYRNEEAVGEGLASADVAREDVFLATKVWISNLSYEDVLETTAASLDKLGTDYVDLLYVHWPARTYDPEETLAAFEELYEEDRIRHIGVSNFEPAHLDRARELLDVPVFANQVEVHPFLQQEHLREYAAENDIELVAYSPLARGDVLGHDVLADIAQRHDASEPQVALAWLRENGVTAIPKATSEAHIRDNFGSLDITLAEDDLARIDAIEHEDRKVDPDFGPDSWD